LEGPFSPPSSEEEDEPDPDLSEPASESEPLPESSLSPPQNLDACESIGYEGGGE
jgi:hypothetical protein